MKLALVLPGGVDRSGEIRIIPVFLALIQRLAFSHEVHVFALHQEAAPGSWSLAGATVHNAGARATAWRTLRAVRAEHRRGQFDLVQSLFSGNCALLATLCARWLRVPIAIHVAGGELVNLRDIHYGGRQRWHGRLRERLVLRGADAVTAASSPMLELLSDIGVVGEKLPLGVDIGTWKPREPCGRDLEQPIRLIHVASLNRVKDQAMLLRSLARVAAEGHTFHLDIVGEDVLGGEIQALCGRLGLSGAVRFHGFLRQSEVRALMEEAHVCLVSSRHEAGPIAMLEAAVTGVPTVGTRVGHVAEWAPVAALAVGVGDAPALAAAIVQLIVDERRRLTIARAAFERAIASDADLTAQLFGTLHDRIAGRRRGRRS
ncbi:MAG TPA: glycosyltransferase family 4 protein [Steroidobacteraceae bacterium]|nr:glycosyltransferase family 4 protein [Steroidobacteraceae bacterium]